MVIQKTISRGREKVGVIKMSKDIKFSNPVPFHKIIEEIVKVIEDKMVNDERSNDKFLEQPSIQEFVKNFENDIDTWKSSGNINELVVRSMGVYLVATLICQLSVFGRPIMFKEQWVNNQLIDMPTYPKNKLPIKYKQTDSKGKPLDYSEIHSLSLMKTWYKKKKGQLKEFLTP